MISNIEVIVAEAPVQENPQRENRDVQSILLRPEIPFERYHDGSALPENVRKDTKPEDYWKIALIDNLKPEVLPLVDSAIVFTDNKHYARTQIPWLAKSKWYCGTHHTEKEAVTLDEWEEELQRFHTRERFRVWYGLSFLCDETPRVKVQAKDELQQRTALLFLTLAERISQVPYTQRVELPVIKTE